MESDIPKSATSEIKKSCFHCGEFCPDDKIHLSEKVFCCEGCKMVFEILQEGDLCNYYDIEKQPGISFKGRKNTDYAFLEEESIIEKLIDFQDEKTSNVRFYLPQIHCTSCIWLLENLYKLSPGIQSSRVNFLKREIQLSFANKEKTLREVVELLASIGYAPEINFSQLNSKKQSSVDRSLYYKLGVAGFAFGNIMLLSFPEYLGLEQISFSYLFGYLNIFLALPVLLYCAKDYLKSAWLGIRQKQLNIDVPVSLGIIALFGRSVFEIVTHTGAGYLDSMAGLVFFLLIGKWFQQKTYHTISFERDYKSYFPIAALVKESTGWKSKPLDKVEVGQTLLIKNQELIPTDGILIKGEANIDYSFVTGEADAVYKKSGDKLFAGGKQLGKSIELSVTKKVEHSYLTQLWNNQAFDKTEIAQSSKTANLIGKFFTIIILVVAFSTLAFWWARDVSIAFNAFTAVLIIACPCAVALAIPFTYGNVLRLLGRQHFYMRNTNVIEAIQDINHIVLDKTGTITDTAQQKVYFKGSLNDRESSLVKNLVSQSSHPLSRSIHQYFKRIEEVPLNYFEEIPGKGIFGVIESQEIKLGSAAYVLKQDYEIGNENHRGVWLEIDGDIKGRFVFKNQYRKGLLSFIQRLQTKFTLSLLSGDNDHEKKRLEDFFKSGKQLHFEQSPKDKLNFISLLQETGDKVMMIGDGLNDAGALEQSNVGVVVTEDINNFTPSCDVIVDAGQFRNLPQIINYIRQSKKVLYGAYALALVYNVVGLSFAVQGLLSPVIAAILMPLSSITIVIFGVGMSTWLYRLLE